MAERVVRSRAKRMVLRAKTPYQNDTLGDICSLPTARRAFSCDIALHCAAHLLEIIGQTLNS